MISDVLFEAKEGIERYLNEPVYSNVYNQDLRDRLNDLIIKMEEIRVELDTSPDVSDIKKQIKRLFERFKTSIKTRCEKAGVDFKLVEAQSDENNEAIVVSLTEGREKREILISSAFEASDLSNFPFENYHFLSGYQAICSYKYNYIEAILVTLEQNSIEPILERLFGVGNIDFTHELDEPDESDELDESDESDESDEFDESDSLDMHIPKLEVKHDLLDNSSITISISPISKKARVFLKDTSDLAISIKLNGLNISRNDEALRYLKDYANAVFFQIDLTTEAPLALKRTKYQEQAILSHYPQNPVEIEYPKCKYNEEAISLYWYARSASGMPLLQYLAYYQIIEFYFPIYSQQKAKNTIQSILKTPGFNVHSDVDIVKLLNIAKAGFDQGFGSERLQLDATIQSCVNISLLRDFLNENQNMKDFFTGKEKTLNLEKLAINENDDGLRKSVVGRIYEVRCRIVHTKTEIDFEKPKSIYPFTEQENLLKHDLRLVHYIAKQILIASSSEFKH